MGCSEFGDYAYFFVDKEIPLPSGAVPGGYPIADYGRSCSSMTTCAGRGGSDREIAVRSRFGAVATGGGPTSPTPPFSRSGPAGRAHLSHGGPGPEESGWLPLPSGRKDLQVKIRGHRVEAPRSRRPCSIGSPPKRGHRPYARSRRPTILSGSRMQVGDRCTRFRAPNGMRPGERMGASTSWLIAHSDNLWRSPPTSTRWAISAGWRIH